jgi:sugar-specific transcriptional regulator TrmB
VEPGEITGSLKGRDALHQQMGTVFKNAKKEISIVTTKEGVNELNSKHADTLKRASGKGVKVKIIAPYGKDTSKAIAAMKKFASVKKGDKPGRFCIVDGDHLLVSLTDEKTHPSQHFSLWTRSQHAAQSTFSPMFEALWSKLPNA